jgi:GxxExxY protein
MTDLRKRQGKQIDSAYRIDLLVQDALIVEVKAVERVLPVHEAQLRTHLRLSGLETGLLFNFLVPVMKDGIRRMSM